MYNSFLSKNPKRTDAITYNKKSFLEHEEAFQEYNYFFR